MSHHDALNWYALVVPAQKEYVAAYLLQRRFGAETYVPTNTRWRLRNRYAKAKEEFAFPVAPRYVFAGFPGTPPWYFLFDMPLIRGVVGIGEEPKRLDNGELRDLRNKVPNGELRVDRITVKENGVFVTKGTRQVVSQAKAPDAERYMKTGREFAAGDAVEIVDGPFRDRIVTVHQIAGQVAKIIIPLLGEDREIDVPIHFLESA